MMHTGDKYEARARAERHYELRRLTKLMIHLILKPVSLKGVVGATSPKRDINDLSANRNNTYSDKAA